MNQTDGTKRLVVWKQTLGIEAKTPRCYSAGSELFVQGSQASDIFLLQSGIVKLSVCLPNGREAILDLRLPGHFIDTSAAFLHAPHATTATAITTCQVHRINSQLFSQPSDSPAITAQLIREQASALYANVLTLTELKLMDGRERFIRFLAFFASGTGSMNKRGPIHLDIPMTDTDIAEFIGVSPRHLIRIKKQLEQEGHLRKEGPFWL